MRNSQPQNILPSEVLFSAPKRPLLNRDMRDKYSIHFRRQVVRIDFHLSVALPLLLLQFHHQLHPFVGQFSKTFVIGQASLASPPGAQLNAARRDATACIATSRSS